MFTQLELERAYLKVFSNSMRQRRRIVEDSSDEDGGSTYAATGGNSSKPYSGPSDLLARKPAADARPSWETGVGSPLGALTAGNTARFAQDARSASSDATTVPAAPTVDAAPPQTVRTPTLGDRAKGWLGRAKGALASGASAAKGVAGQVKRRASSMLGNSPSEPAEPPKSSAPSAVSRPSEPAADVGIVDRVKGVGREMGAKVKDKLRQVGGGVVDAARSAGAKVKDKVGGAVDDIIADRIGKASSRASSELDKFRGDVDANVAGALTNMEQQANTAVDNFTSNFNANVTGALDNAKRQADAAIGDIRGNIDANVAAAIANAKGQASTALQQFTDVELKKSIESAKTQVDTAIKEITANIPGHVDDAVKGVKDKLGSIFSGGGSFLSNLFGGGRLGSGGGFFGSLLSSVRDFASSALMFMGSHPIISALVGIPLLYYGGGKAMNFIFGGRRRRRPRGRYIWVDDDYDVYENTILESTVRGDPVAVALCESVFDGMIEDMERHGFVYEGADSDFVVFMKDGDTYAFNDWNEVDESIEELDRGMQNIFESVR